MNVWSQISLEDYETHMSHKTVMQAQLLSSILSEKLNLYKPKSMSIWGIAGGNGLEHIDSNITKEVVGIDINGEFLKQCKNPYQSTLENLKLYNCDLSSNNKPEYKTDFIYAALILEYVSVKEVLLYATKCLNKDSTLTIVVQNDNGNHSISETDIESIKKIGDVFNTVSIENLKNIVSDYDLHICSDKEYSLSSGKSFRVIDIFNS